MRLLANLTAKSVYYIKKYPGVAAGVVVGTLLPRPLQKGVQGAGVVAGSYLLAKTKKTPIEEVQIEYY